MASLYQEVRMALGDSGFKPRKRWGQNFLIHERVIDSILRLLDLSPSDEVVEIGPGLGFLTRRLAENDSKVWAVEIDLFLVEWLRGSSLSGRPGVQLIHDDILKLPLDQWLPEHKVKLVANLPYSISTPALYEVPVNPYRVIWDAQQVLDLDQTIATHDAGNPRDQTAPFWLAKHPNSYIGWGKSTHLGYSLPLALGAKVELSFIAVRP